MAGRLKHVLLATGEDPSDPKSWSGIPFSLREALERRVERVSVYRPPPPSRNPVDAAKRLVYGAAKYPLWITLATLRNNARGLAARVLEAAPDAILSISSTCLAELGDVGRPVFLFSDAPYQAFHEAYRGTIDRPMRLEWFEAREAAAARRLAGLCFSSQWAVDEALRIYGPEVRAKVHVTPMGSNWAPSLSREELLARVDARPADRIDFLFVGRDWERKGGPLAVEVVRLLRAGGRAARLHVVGCRPELTPEDQNCVTLHGALYRNNAEQAAKLQELFLGSHFLLVPTVAECFGLAFGEAQAFALPPISRAVHALPGVVLDGETGLLFAADAPAAEYLPRILALVDDRARYRQMAAAARTRFEQVLNWDAMASTLVEVMERSL